jgi:hypothetical protein
MHLGFKLRTLLPLVVAFAAMLVLSSSAFAQCSMCRAALAGSNNAFFIRNFNIGVLVLLVPPVTIFCSIFVVLKRYKATDDEESTVVSTESGVAEDSGLKTRDS